MMRKGICGILSIGMFLLLNGCGGGGGGGTTGGTTTTATSSIPSTPTGLYAQVISSTQINLSWNASSDDVEVMGYYLYRGGSVSVIFSTSTAVTGLSPDTQYCFSVAAFDGEGNTSVQSSAVCATTSAGASSAWTTVRSGTSNDFSNAVWTGSELLLVEESFSSPTTVHKSADGLSWANYPTSGFAFNGAKDIAYGNNRFVAVDSWTFTSSDGIAWQYTALVGANAVAWSPSAGLFVAVGDSGYIGTSTDGVGWTTRTSPTSAYLYGVAWLNDRFVAVGEVGTILTSVNGIDWVQMTASSSFALSSVAWNGQTGGGALYIATGYSTVFTSTDAVTWTEVATPPPGFNDSVAWGGGSANCFVAVGSDNHIFSSPDGENWTRRFLATAPTTAQLSLNEVVWTGTRFVAVGQQGTILVSDDGLSWNMIASGADLNGVTHDGSRFIAFGNNGRVAISSDAASWEYRHTGDDAHYLRDLAWDGTRYVAVGQTYSLYSTDLSSWHASWEGATSVDTAVIWDGSQFVRTGDGIMTWDTISYYSGTSDPDWAWSYSTEWFNDLYWDGSKYVAVGNSGVIYTSTDATVGPWNPQSSGTSANLNALTKGTGRFVAVGSGGTILTSDDNGTTWLAQSSGVSSAIYDVTWTGSEFVAVGYAGLILTSSDGTSWTSTIHGSNHLYGVLSNGTDTVIVGAEGSIIKNTP